MAYSGDSTGPWTGQGYQDPATLEHGDGAVQYPVMPLRALYIDPALRSPLPAAPPTDLQEHGHEPAQPLGPQAASQQARPQRTRQHKDIRHRAQKRRLFLRQQSHPPDRPPSDAYGSLVPLAPPSISSNPDHHLYPSFQFMDHSIAAAVRQQRHELQQDEIKARQTPPSPSVSALSQQPRSSAPLQPGHHHSSGAHVARPPPVQSHLRFLAQAKTWNARQHRSASSRRKAPTSHPSSSLGQGLPAAAVAAAVPPSPSPLFARPVRPKSSAFATRHLNAHPPPHPSAYFLPLLQPASTLGLPSKGFGAQRRAKRSRGASPAVDELSRQSDANATSTKKRRRTSQSTHHMTEPNSLPYGRAAPAIVLLNQPPYIDLVSDILAEADVNSDQRSTLRLRLYDGEAAWPAWMAAYLQTSSLRRAWATPTTSLPHTLHLPTPSPMSFMRIPPSDPPDAAILSTCLDNYAIHVHTIYPILPPERQRTLVADFLNHAEAPIQHQRQPIECINDHDQARAQLAIELLVFALGSVYWVKSDAVILESGPEFYTRAKGILQSIADDYAKRIEDDNDNHDTMSRRTSNGSTDQVDCREENEQQGRTPRRPSTSQEATVVAATLAPVPTMDLARAHLLAALFCSQLAWLQEAACHIRSAADAVHRMLLRLGVGTTTGGTRNEHGLLPLFGSNKPACDFTDYERQLVVLYWICVQLEFEINADAGQPPSALLRYQSTVPVPDFAAWRASAAGAPASDAGAVGGPLQPPLNTQKDFEAQVVFHSYRNRIYQEAFVSGPSSQRSIPYNMAPAVAELTLQFDSFSIAADTNLPASCKSILTARAHFAYWEVRAYAALHGFLRPGPELTTNAAAEAVRSLIGVVSAHQGRQNGFHLLLPNAFGMAMAQCRYLLLLFAASRLLQVVAPLVDDGMLAELIDGTLASLDNVAGPFGVVEAARRVLAVLKSRLAFQSAPGLDHQYAVSSHAPLPGLAAAAPIVPTEPGPPPQTGLSVFCPRFSDAPDSMVGGVLTTASSASSSFQSVPTPSTPPSHPHGMLSSSFASPFASPVSSAFSPSPSGSFSTYYLASPFKPPTKQLPSLPIMDVPASSCALQCVPEHLLPAQASPAVDMQEFATELGIDNISR